MPTETLTVEDIEEMRKELQIHSAEDGASRDIDALCDAALRGLRSQVPTIEQCYAAGKGPEQMHTFREGGLPNTPEERARFEAYMRGHCWSLGEYSDEPGCYDTVLVRMLYGVWRDRGSLAAPPSSRQAQDQRESAAQGQAETPPATQLTQSDSHPEFRLALEMAAKDVIAERERQKAVEGWTIEHDDQHTDRALAAAAWCYVEHYVGRAWVYEAGDHNAYKNESIPDHCPMWDVSWWRPKNPRRDLVRAAALIIAEIERLDRALLPAGEKP